MRQKSDISFRMHVLNRWLMLRLTTTFFLVGASTLIYPSPITAALTMLLCLISSHAVLIVQGLFGMLWLTANCLTTLVSPDFLGAGESYFRLLQAALMIVLLIRRIPLIGLPSRWHRFSSQGAAVFLALALCLAATSVFRKYPLAWTGWAAVLVVYAHQIGRIPVGRLLRLAFALTFSATIMFFILEGGTRLVLPVSQKPGGLFDLDEEAIFVLRPGATAEYEFLDNSGNKKDWKVAISSQGIRDRGYGRKSPDEFRILTVGDSFTMGQPLENPEDTYQRELERMLNTGKPSKHIAVINGGVAGYAPWQERIFLRDRGFGFEPDLVILQLFPGNDIAGSYTKEGKYLEALDVRWEQEVINFKRQQEYPFYAERWCQSHSNLYRLVCSISNNADLVARIVMNLRMVPESKVPSLTPLSNRLSYHEACLVNWYPGLHEAWSIFEESVCGIRNDCRERGISLLAFVHGQYAALDPVYWANLGEAFPNAPYEMNKDLRVTDEMLTRLDIPHPGVQAAFNAYPVPEDLYYLMDGHFTPQGTRVLADCIHGFIMTRLWNTGWWKYPKED